MASLGKWDQTLAAPNTPVQNLVKGQANPTQGKFTNAVQKTGAFDIPVLGGLLRGAVQPLTSGAEMVAQAGGETGAALTGQTSAPQFVPPQMQQLLNQRTTAGLDSENANSRQIATEGIKQAANTGLDIAALNSLPGLVKNAPETAKQASGLLGYLTKGGVGAKIGNAYEKATASGVTDSWPDFVTEVKQTVAKKLGNNSNYQDLVHQRLAPEVPASLDASPQITPNQLFDLKQQASNRLPSGFLSKFQGKSAGNQVDEIIRDVAAKRGIDVTPGVKGLNNLYSAYSKVGSPARIAANVAISKLIPDQIKAPLGGDTGITGGLTLLENILRMGGKL